MQFDHRLSQRAPGQDEKSLSVSQSDIKEGPRDYRDGSTTHFFRLSRPVFLYTDTHLYATMSDPQALPPQDIPKSERDLELDESDDKGSLAIHPRTNHPLDLSPPFDNLPYDAQGEPQNGVLQMEAITAVWSKKSLIVVYILWVFRNHLGVT
jgi:hypothetical protein